jgi:two-component system chemotaxis response regulator CheB
MQPDQNLERSKAPAREIRVLLAEDSATVRWHLTQVINETPGMRVIAEARNGQEALEMAQQLKPDVISMDINMPRMDGLESTRRIMTTCPTPVVVVSSLVDKDIDLSLQALESGALAVVEKPPDRRSAGFAEKQATLVRTLAAMAAVRVIRRSASTPAPTSPPPAMPSTHPELIAVGASAGGPSALSTLLKALPVNAIPAPIVIVQHMPHEFIPGLARWLDKSSGWPVHVAVNGQRLEAGNAYLSPGTAHMTVQRVSANSLTIRLIDEAGGYRYQPSVDVLFDSVAAACGSKAAGIILTGMGDDGAAGLLAMYQAGAQTFAQDQASSTVFGMPSAALERGAVRHTLPLAALPAAIMKLM